MFVLLKPLVEGGDKQIISNIRECICYLGGEDDLTLFHKVSVELVQLGARRSTLQGAHSQGEAGAE